MRRIQSGQREFVAWKQTGISQIVRGKKGFELAKRWLQLHIHRDQTGMPIVAVDDMGGEIPGMHQRDKGSTEKDESLRIVVIVAIGIAVKMGPVKHIFPVDDIYRGGIFNRQFAHLKGQALRTQPCVQVGPDRFLMQTVFKHLSITRKNHANIHVQLPQRIGKTACYIGQSPGFGKRRSFRCDEDHAKRCHYAPILLSANLEQTLSSLV